jgi:putative ABC transport system permease protein
MAGGRLGGRETRAGMITREGLRIAVRGIAANRLRSFLTVLGVSIGVAAVILLVAVGRGSAVSVERQIQSLGTNILTVFAGGGFGFAGPGGGGGPGGGASRTGTLSSFNALTMKDVKALNDKTLTPDVQSVSPVVNASATATFGDATYSPEQFFGSTPSIAEARNYEVASGAFFTEEDERQHRKVVVLGPTVVFNLFGATNPVGQVVKLNGISFSVVGVLEPRGSNGIQDQDDIAIAPLSAVQDTLAGGSTLSQIVVQATSAKTVDLAEAEVTNVLQSTHPADLSGASTFRVLSQASLLETTSSTNRTFTVLLGAVAAISLLVGGIGVMNIMLVSVTERTREIGIRKAIGAQRSDVVGQFIAEAILLSMIGGLVGVAAGIAGSRFEIVGVQPVVQLYSVVLAFTVAVGVGLFFGIYPAHRAASLRPIDALRYE